MSDQSDLRGENIGRARAARLGAFVLWYTIPTLAVLGVIAYMAGAVVWHANPPIVPVAGVSMRPTLQPGDLVVLKGVEEDELKKGDIVAFEVPQSAQEDFAIPGPLVHRISKLERSGDTLVIHTKGDANTGEDAFTIRADRITGRMVRRVPGGGYPLLFFRSRQGKIFGGATILVILLYFLLGVLDRRRELADVNMLSLATIVVEARELKETMQQTVTSARGPPAAVTHPAVEHATIDPAEPNLSSLPPETRALHLAEFQLAPVYREDPDPRPEQAFSTALVPYVPPQPLLLPIDFGKLEEEIHRAVSSSEDVKDTMLELVGAIGEYGEHLRSHTDVMKNIAASSGELRAATAEMRTVLMALAQAVERLADRRAPGGPQ